MPRVGLTSTTAFVLRVDPLSEKDLVAAFLTRDRGVVRAAVKGARGKTRRGAALQLLTEVDVTLFAREGADLARVESVEIVSSAFALASRPETSMLLPYLAESAATFVPEQEPGGDVYRLVRHVLDALAAAADPALAARYFEVWLLRFAGLLPEDDGCASCGEALAGSAVLLDPTIPGFVHPGCRAPGSFEVPAEARGFLSRARRSPLPSLAAEAPATLESVEALTREVRRRFLGHELKSYRFLRALEADRRPSDGCAP